MADPSRLEDLRRRVEKDPASIAFAQLAEEYRRAGEIERAIQVCRAGLEIHPGYLSARVTLGRALIESNQLDDAQAELEQVLHSAPENLAAIRGLAEIHHRRGHLPEALDQYRAAFAIARNDPDLERTVEELSRKIEPQPRAEPDDGLSFASLHAELLAHAAAAPETATSVTAARATRVAPATSVTAAVAPAPVAAPAVDLSAPAQTQAVRGGVEPGPAESGAYDIGSTVAVGTPAVAVLEASALDAVSGGLDLAALDVHTDAIPAPVPAVEPPLAAGSRYNVAADPSRDRAHRTIAALERWLDALNVSRTHSRA